MKTLVATAAVLVLAAPLLPQTTTTIGGTSSAPTRTGLGKGNGISIKSSVLLLSFDMYLNVPGQETLQFFMYHHHSTNGTFKLMKTWKVPVNGKGKGATWYSSGVIAQPLLCGNSYILGVAWTGSLTYHYNVATCGQQIALGAWLTGRTARNTNPLPANMVSTGCDRAQYYQRFKTLPFTNVACVGTSCSPSTNAPRLLASTPPKVGTTLTIELVGGAASKPATLLISPARALATPVQISGCPVWLDLRLPVLAFGLPLSSAGEVKLQIPIPANSAKGVRVALQAAVLSSTLDITNALDLLSY